MEHNPRNPKKTGETPIVQTPNKFTPDRQEIFLQFMEDEHRLNAAARAAGVSQMTVWRLLETSPEFNALFQLAKQRHFERIEKEVYRRGVLGREEQLTFQGRLTGETKTVYSDRLLEFYTKRHIAEYRDQKDDRKPIPVNGGAGSVDFAKLPRDKRDLIRRLLAGDDIIEAEAVDAEMVDITPADSEEDTGEDI